MVALVIESQVESSSSSLTLLSSTSTLLLSLLGLINAASLALRFNRTLLIRSMNGFDKLFKPKYEVDPNDVVYRDPNDYTYHERNWTVWTKYNPIWQDNDREELGIYIKKHHHYHHYHHS